MVEKKRISKDPVLTLISKRAQKLYEKLEESSPYEKSAWFAQIIKECEYNQTSNKSQEDGAFLNNKNKPIRKKTIEETKLLEYFLEQDPEWTRVTVVTAAKVLGLSNYQVYKWGYDRKNRNFVYASSNPDNKNELNSALIEKFNKIREENNAESKKNLNQQVDDIFCKGLKYKNFNEAWTEFPITEHQFYGNHVYLNDAQKPQPKLNRIYSEEVPNKVFKVKKVNKRRKISESESDNHSENQDWESYSPFQSKELAHELNQDGFHHNLKDETSYEAFLNDNLFEPTVDKSRNSASSERIGSKADFSEHLDSLVKR